MISNIVVKNLQTALEELTTVVPSGSYFIFGNNNTDIDFFVLGSRKVHDWLKANGFRCALHAVPADELENSMNNVDGFVSYRKDKFNVICVNTISRLKQMKLATELCAALKIKSKPDTLRVFNAIQLGIVSDRTTLELEQERKHDYQKNAKDVYETGLR